MGVFSEHKKEILHGATGSEKITNQVKNIRARNEYVRISKGKEKSFEKVKKCKS